MLKIKIWVRGKLTSHQIIVSAKRIVCPTCDGSGSHVNRNIDGNGITAEEHDQLDDEWRQNYMSGAYDVVCEQCHGKNVIEIVDREELTLKMLKRLMAYEAEERECRQTEADERRCGA